MTRKIHPQETHPGMQLLRLGDWRLLEVSRERLREQDARGVMGRAQLGLAIGGQGPPHLFSAEPERKAGGDAAGDPVPRRLLVYNVLDWCRGKRAAAVPETRARAGG